MLDWETMSFTNSGTAYYIKADPKSNIAGLKLQDILFYFFKFG